MRDTEIIAGERLFLVCLSCRASNEALVILSEMSASLGFISYFFSSGWAGMKGHLVVVRVKEMPSLFPPDG